MVSKYMIDVSKMNISLVPPQSVNMKLGGFQSQLTANLASVSTNIAYESYKDSNIGQSH